MAGENIDLKILIKALLDAKGFEEAQASLKGLAGAANSAKAPTEGLTDKHKGLTKELGGSRGAVADMTRVLLQNIGVTGPAGEVAKALGTSMSFLGGAAGIAAVAATGVVGVAALLVPKLIELAKDTEDLKKQAEEAAQKIREIRQAMIDALPDLQHYAETLRPVPEYLKSMIEAARSLALDEQHQKFIVLADDLDRLRGELGKNVEKLADYEAINAASYQGNVVAASKIVDLRAEMERQRATIASTQAQMRELAIAENAHLTVGELRLKNTKAGTKAIQDENKANAEKLQLERDIAKESARRQQQENKDRAEGKKKQQEDLKFAAQRLVELETESGSHLENAKKAIKAHDEEARRVREAEAEKRGAYAQTAGEASAALLSFFGKNKAAAIAQALADTFAGADKALAQGGFFGIAMAAAVVAAGLANVANIRKQEVGFDDPFSDLLAQKLGRKSAADFVRHFGIGFEGAMGGGSTVNNYHSSTTVNRGTSVGAVNYNSIVGARKTQQLKQLNRDLIGIARMEDRTRIGR